MKLQSFLMEDNQLFTLYMYNSIEIWQSPRAGFIAVREMSGRNKISQGQGIVREFCKVSGKIDEKRHGIPHNVRENDHFRQHDSPVSMYPYRPIS